MSRLFIVSLLAVVTWSTLANAGFVANYSKWKEMSRQTKDGYVQGMWDQLSVMLPMDADGQALALGASECSLAISLKSGMLVDAVDGYYEKNPKTWAEPPGVALYRSMVYLGPCLSYVNAEREKRGLQPIKPTDTAPTSP